MKRINQSCSAILAVLFSLAGNLAAADHHAVPHANGPEAAREALKHFTTAPDLEVSLFASEPMVRNPTDMDIDERGRVWVTEGVNYRSTIKPWGILEPAGDRLVILEDTNGDGIADKATTFYQGPEINTAMGVCVLGNKAIVSCSPNIYVFTDTVGDGVAHKKEILFSGISGVGHDHGVHAVSFGPDGKLYFNFGNYGGQLKDKDGKPVIDIEGNVVDAGIRPCRGSMAFRCNLDGSEVEVLGYNFRNPYQIAVDSFGTCWQSDNDDDGNRSVRLNYVMEHGNFGFVDEMTGASWTEKHINMEDTIPRRHWHQNDPGVVPNLIITGAGAPTGMTIYEGNLFPAKYQNQIMEADAGSRLVRSYPVTDDGAGYKAEGMDMLATPDTWFRPTDVCVAPDGSVYVSDWNDAGVGGHGMADHDPATMTGRIYRLVPKGAKPVAPALDLKTAAGCVQALESPNISTRYLAWSALDAMPDHGKKALLILWKSRANPRFRARALWLLAQQKEGAGKYVAMALKDKNPDLRVTGLRIAVEQKLDVIPFVKNAVKDPSPKVRAECAIALRHNPSPDAPGLWAALAQQHDGRDRWYLEALGIGADKQEDAFFDAWLASVGDHWNTLAGRDIIWRSRAAKVPPLLVKIILDKNTPANERPHYFRAFDFNQPSAKDGVLTDLLLATLQDSNRADNDLIFETLACLKSVNLKANQSVRAAMQNVLESVRGTPEFVNIVRDFQLPGQDAGLMEVARKFPKDEAAVDAMRLIIADDQVPLIEAALRDTNYTASLLEPLGNTLDTNRIPLISSYLTDPKQSPAVRRAAAQALTLNHWGALELIKLAEADKLPNEVKFILAAQLSRVRWMDVRDKAAAVLPLPQSRDGKSMPPVMELLKMPGDVSRGAKVFTRPDIGCIVCHRVNGQGADVGPELSEIGTKLGKDALYESILDPSASIEFGFEAWRIELKTGDELYGIIKSETADELTIKDAKAAATHVNKSDIVARQQLKISLMPAGLQQTMSTQDLVDLVDYLSSLKKAAK